MREVRTLRTRLELAFDNNPHWFGAPEDESETVNRRKANYAVNALANNI